MFGVAESEIEEETCQAVQEKDSITNLEITIQSARERISRNCTSISHIMSELDKVQSLFKRFSQPQYHTEYNEDMLKSISSEDVTDNYNLASPPEKLKQHANETVRQLSDINKSIEKSLDTLN